jgi:hypothetical protein
MSRVLRYSAATGRLLFGGTGHLLNATPFACNGSPMPTLTFSGFDAMSPCESCSEHTTHQPWDGTLMPTSACVWQGRNADGYGANADDCLTVNGQPLHRVALAWEPTIGLWMIELHGDAQTVWIGYGPVDDSPAGTYWRIDGCWDEAQMTVSL